MQLHAAPKDHWFLLNISRNELYILNPSGNSLNKLVAKKNLLSPIAQIGYMDLDIYGGLRLLDKQNQRIWHFPARAEFQALQEAKNHLKKQEYTEALNRYKTVVSLDPSNSEALREMIDLYLLLSAVAMQKKRHDRAQTLLRELLEIQPSNKIAVTRMRLLLIDEHRDWFTLIFSGLSLIFAGLFLIPNLIRRIRKEQLDFNLEKLTSVPQEDLIETEDESPIVSNQIHNEIEEQNSLENAHNKKEDKISSSDTPNHSAKTSHKIESSSDQSSSASENQETNLENK